MRAKSSKVVKQRDEMDVRDILLGCFILGNPFYMLLWKKVLPTEIQPACFTCLASFINMPLTVT